MSLKLNIKMNNYQRILQHQKNLEQCCLCQEMSGPPVHGLPILSKVMLIGQAPGFKEIEVLKPFAWTAGKKLFSWFETIDINEKFFRQHVYMSAICRCYPGKKQINNTSEPSLQRKAHGDRVPNKQEIAQCAPWLQSELDILKPELIILVGKLAITQFMNIRKLDEVIGQTFTINIKKHSCDVIALPHPSGASTWPIKEPGKTLLQQAMLQISKHPSWQKL